MFVCLFGFLTSSSTTRLYRGRAPRQERLTILRAEEEEEEEEEGEEEEEEEVEEEGKGEAAFMTSFYKFWKLTEE